MKRQWKSATFASLKQILAIIVLAGILGQTFSKYLVVLDYQLNKDVIARTLCVNRNKPGIKCEGRCYLCKRLQQEDKKDQENPERRTELKFESLSASQPARLLTPIRLLTTLSYPRYDEDLQARSHEACFHPPQC